MFSRKKSGEKRFLQARRGHEQWDSRGAGKARLLSVRLQKVQQDRGPYNVSQQQDLDVSREYIFISFSKETHYPPGLFLFN